MQTGENASEASRGSSRVWYQSEDLLFALGAGAWLIALLVRWPDGLSYSDEIGYLGQAKLFLEGHIRWVPGAPGIWNRTPDGLVSQYPLLIPALLAPLFAIAPAAIFLMGVVPALVLAWSCSRILKSWGHSPCWALIFLAHPTVVTLARTVMSDLLLAVLALGAWWSLRNRRAVPAILLLAFTMAARPTGIPIAAAIIAGDLLEKGHRPTHPIGATLKEARVGILGFVLGLLLVLTANALATGTIWFGYNYRPGTPSFAAKYFLTSAPAHLRALLVNPPLLLLGVIPLWRRRLWAPLLAIAAMGALMCFYFWVEWGRTWVETVVLSERLILPIVAFLLVGYAAGLSGIAARLRLTSAAKIILVVAPAVVAFAIGSQHHRWQQPMRDAREAAARLALEMGSHELGLNYQSSKAGLLFPGKTSWIDKNGPRPAVLLCGTRGNSYRTLTPGVPERDRCDARGYPGYHQVSALDGFVLLLSDEAQAPTR